MSSDRQHHLPFICNYQDYQTNIQKPNSEPSDAKETVSRTPSVESPPKTIDQTQCVFKSQSPTSQPTVITSQNDQVFVRLADGRFQLGRVLKLTDTQCLIQLPDESEQWANRTEVTRLSAKHLEPICIVCKSASQLELIAQCVKCGRSYHPKCVTASDDGIWFCRRGHRNVVGGDTITDAVFEGTADQRSMVLVDEVKRMHQLPYNIKSLIWDKAHHNNIAQIYCYCGGNGEWFMQMLQCARCRQWFHEMCLNLTYPLYCGDRFYIFVCSMCNNGTEFVRRLQIKLDELVHLLLFNLSVHNARKYFDLAKVIVPYAIDNWPALQLKPNLKNLSVAEIKEQIIKTIQMNPQLFRLREADTTSGKAVQYSLAIPIAPPQPTILLKIPAIGAPVTEKWLREHNKDKAKLQLLPKSLQCDLGADLNEMRYTMTGKSYFKFPATSSHFRAATNNNPSDKDDHFTSEDDDEVLANLAAGQKFSSNPPSSSSTSSSCLPPTPPTSVSRPPTPNGSTTVDSDIYDYCSAKEDSQDVVHLRPKLLHTQHKRKRGRPTGSTKSFISSMAATFNQASHRSREATEALPSFGYSSDDNSSRGTLDLIIPPPKDFQGFNNPFLIQIKEPSAGTNGLHLKSTKANITSSLFGPFSGSSSGGSQVRLVRTVKRKLSVRDIVIGPNMEVKRRKIRRPSGNYEVISTTAVHTVPSKPYQLPIRSDSKDSSGSSSNTSNASTPSGSCTPTLPPPPPPPPSQPVYRPEESYGLGGRRLRRRGDTNYYEKPRRTSIVVANGNGAPSIIMTTTTDQTMVDGTLNQITGTTISSPVKKGDVSLTELQTSLTMYFGVANRIANGERFAVRGRRIGLDGQQQYLIEWDAVP